MDSIDTSNISAHAALLGARYGFSQVEISDRIPARARPAVLDAAAIALESLSHVIARGGDIALDSARSLCGLAARTSLRLVHPEELPPGIGASFGVKAFGPAISICGLDRPESDDAPAIPAASHLAHEWAHSLDHALGQGMRGSAHPVGMERHAGLPSIAKASLSRAPYQSILGALAVAQHEAATSGGQYASLAAASGSSTPLPAFARLAKSMLPGFASALRRSARASRSAESSAQMTKLSAFAESAAHESLLADPDIQALKLPVVQLSRLAAFCAEAVQRGSHQESSRRRGRESAIDHAKSDIATMLERSFRLPAAAASRVASSVLHISPVKSRHDEFFAAPYTGRSTWESPGSLADLSCALVRVGRNQRALENSRLAKEKYVPMAFWWTMRREVSEISSHIDSHAESLISHYANAGMLPEGILAHTQAWSGQHGEYKAGALVFSDLIGTGAKMIMQEAALMGSAVNHREARAIRRKIATPIDDLAKRKTITESIAESFEQFIGHQAQMRTPLGRACKIAMDRSLVDPDPLERAAALDPASSWMHNKPADPAANSRRWRALLRELPAMLPGQSFAEAPASKRGSKP